MIISIEGPDFVGKNSVIETLLIKAQEHLENGYKVKVISFPNTETEIGRICRQMLKKTTEWDTGTSSIFQLLNTAHRYEYWDLLKQAKQDPHLLLFIIRYNLSGPVYACVDGLDTTKTWQLYDWFNSVLPDITFIIFRDFDFAKLPEERNPDHYETETKQEQVRRIYSLAPTLWPDKLGEAIFIENKNIENTVEKIVAKLKKFLLNG